MSWSFDGVVCFFGPILQTSRETFFCCMIDIEGFENSFPGLYFPNCLKINTIMYNKMKRFFPLSILDSFPPSNVNLKWNISPFSKCFYLSFSWNIPCSRECRAWSAPGSDAPVMRRTGDQGWEILGHHNHQSLIIKTDNTWVKLVLRGWELLQQGVWQKGGRGQMNTSLIWQILRVYMTIFWLS